MDLSKTEHSDPAATLAENSLADLRDALTSLNQARNIVGQDQLQSGRELSLAITHIEDAWLRIGRFKDLRETLRNE